MAINSTETHDYTPGFAASMRSAVFMPAVLAVLLGVFFIFGVALASPTTIHNAAHDGRHAFAFPCH